MLRSALSNGDDVKQAIAALLVRLGAILTQPVLRRFDPLESRMDRLAERIDARVDAVEASMGVLHRAIEELGAIPSLSTELLDGIAEAEARAAATLTEVERLLAGR